MEFDFESDDGLNDYENFLPWDDRDYYTQQEMWAQDPMVQEMWDRLRSLYQKTERHRSKSIRKAIVFLESKILPEDGPAYDKLIWYLNGIQCYYKLTNSLCLDGEWYLSLGKQLYSLYHYTLQDLVLYDLNKTQSRKVWKFARETSIVVLKGEIALRRYTIDHLNTQPLTSGPAMRVPERPATVGAESKKKNNVQPSVCTGAKLPLSGEVRSEIQERVSMLTAEIGQLEAILEKKPGPNAVGPYGKGKQYLPHWWAHYCDSTSEFSTTSESECIRNETES